MTGRWNRGRLLPDLLPILVVEGRVLFPGMSMVVHVKDPKGVKLVETKVWNEDSWNGKYIGIIPQKTKDDKPKLHHRGTAAAVIQAAARSHPLPHYVLLVVGLCRFEVNEIKQEVPFITAVITQLDYLNKQDPLPREVKALADAFRECANELFQLLDIHNSSAIKLKHHLSSLSDERLPDFFTSLVKSSFEEQLEVLDAVSLSERFKVAQPLLQRQIETLKLLRKASRTSLDSLAKIPHNHLVSNRQLTDDNTDETEDEIAELEQRLKAASLPEHALKAAQKELKRLKALPSQFPEHAVCRNYLDTILDLPWSKSTTDQLCIAKAKECLDSEHYGLAKLKKRVLEYLAVRQLKNDLKGPILCFVGAPGVGKTSLGRSIAKTLGRKFHRISLGGTCDQSDIRGHRRTYIGSMPGRIIQGLKAAGTKNPVFLLDEVDKLHTSLQGDPAAALLEVLDPEQNSSFTDHYLGIPFDLSQVMFVATANTVATIPPALLDRMEVIEVPGYTEEEKIQIAVRHLLPKQLEQHGLTTDQLQISPEAILEIVAGYTQEAGVRCLEREIASVCRTVAVKIAESKTPAGIKMPITITPDTLKDVLGQRKYEHEISERLTRPGVAVGLAWTSNGGEIMFVEATRMAGRGKLVLTGQLGDVMKESARIALNWLRSNASVYGVVCDQPSTTDVHIHFPAGAVGKDGPSAGVAIVTVLASLFSGRCTRSDTAMTGEVTLRGLVLPVGGIKEKVLAAHRAGIKHIILPLKNQKDVVELSDGPKSALKFTWVSNLDEVLLNAFDGGLKSVCKL